MAAVPESIDPIALGIISDPPVLILTYSLCDTSLSKGRNRRQRRMPVRLFTDRSDVNRAYFVLQQRHEPYLSGVSSVTVIKMLRIVQEVMKGLEMDEAIQKVDSEFAVDPDEDLNKVSLDQLAQKKEIMDEAFLKKLIKPGDPNFVYDKFENFEALAKERSDWDEDEDCKGVEISDTKIQSGEDNVNQQSVTADIVNVEISSVKDEGKMDTGAGESIPPVLEVEAIPDNQNPLDEDLLSSICDEDLLNHDTLLSLCDFNISLPFGDGDSFDFGDTNKLGETDEKSHENETMPSKDSSRDRLYLCDEENVDFVQDVERLPYTVIDIGTSFLSDASASMLEDQEGNEKPSKLANNFSLLKLEIEDNVDDLLENAARISEMFQQTFEVPEKVTTTTLDKKSQKVEEFHEPEPSVQILNQQEEKKVTEKSSSSLGESKEESKESDVAILELTPSNETGATFKANKDNQLASAVDISDIESLLDDDFWNL